MRLWKWLTKSRKRVFWYTLLFLLLLDGGRSWYARVGFTQAYEPWQDAPYEAVSWPPGSDLPDDTPMGKRVYLERCAICHGENGRGNGPAAPSMIPRPRDFTAGVFKYKSTSFGQIPTHADLVKTVTFGLQASAMPYWGDVLTPEEIDAVVNYAEDFSGIVAAEEPFPITIPPRVPPDAASVARGKDLFVRQGCIGCHGDDGRSMTTHTDQKGYPLPARDLTAPWTFRGGSEPEQIWLRLTTGLPPGPMFSFEERITADERWDIVNFLLANARTPPWEPGGVIDGPGQKEDLFQRGAYITHFEMCGLCHTQVNDDLIYSGDEYYLAGGMGIPIYPQGTFVSRNLTGDIETGLGDWTVEEIASAIRNGSGKDRNLNFWGMPWMILHSFEQEDALAIATFLKNQTPVINEIPLTLKYGFVETVVAKTLYSSGFPPIGNPEVLVYRAGNFGDTSPESIPRGWLQSVLISAQWLILLLGAAAFFGAASPEERWPDSVWGWTKFGLKGIGLGVLAFLLWVIYSTPVLPFIPPEQINLAVTSTILTPDPASLSSPEEASLAARGEYLFKTSSCAFCHGNLGGGGAKINSPAFGTIWARNISSDAETGIGAWTDEEIGRAIRSGISKDGGVLHWQGMVWDHLSNLDEVDLRAIIVYLRTLPAIENEIPAPVPPSPDDCADYTFFIVETFSPGCSRE